MTEKDKQKLIKYIYNFASQYGKLSSLGNEKKILSSLEEKLLLPEDFVEKLLKETEKEKIW